MRALITGCSTGIGRATALELTKRGHEVVATARRPETLKDLDVAQTLALDVNDDASVQAALGSAGEIDILVNNAGFGMFGAIEEVPMDEIRRCYETNVFGVLRMLQAFVPGMRTRQRGAIVNVSSVAGRVSSPLGGIYSSTKYAVEAISEALHYELNHFGIRVILIEPGAIETEFGANEGDFRSESTVYDELARQFSTSTAVLGGDAPTPGPELVATTIAEALEADPYQLRWPVGADADLIISTRTSLDDATFESTMRQVLNLTW
jgi:short-subunit dehydrogenase